MSEPLRRSLPGRLMRHVALIPLPQDKDVICESFREVHRLCHVFSCHRITRMMRASVADLPEHMAPLRKVLVNEPLASHLLQRLVQTPFSDSLRFANPFEHSTNHHHRRRVGADVSTSHCLSPVPTDRLRHAIRQISNLGPEPYQVAVKFMQNAVTVVKLGVFAPLADDKAIGARRLNRFAMLIQSSPVVGIGHHADRCTLANTARDGYARRTSPVRQTTPRSASASRGAPSDAPKATASGTTANAQPRVEDS